MAALRCELCEAGRIGAHYAPRYADAVGCLVAVALLIGILVAGAIGVAP